MNSIWVNANELYQIIRHMRRDNISAVCLRIREPVDDGDDDPLPATLELSGIKSSDPDVEIDYTDMDGLEALDVNPSVVTSSSLVQ